MIKRFLKDQRAISATEFALVLPFLVLLYVGGYQLSDAISAYRKVTFTTRTIADLASQYTSVSDDDLDTILNASQQVLAPYKIENATMLVSQIKIDASLNATVDWSRGKNVTPLTVGGAYNIPASIKQANTYLIISTVNYNYTSNVATQLIGSIPMKDQIILSPRATNQIKKT